MLIHSNSSVKKTNFLLNPCMYELPKILIRGAQARMHLRQALSWGHVSRRQNALLRSRGELFCEPAQTKHTAHDREPQSNQPFTLTVRTPQCEHCLGKNSGFPVFHVAEYQMDPDGNSIKQLAPPLWHQATGRAPRISATVPLGCTPRRHGLHTLTI